MFVITVNAQNKVESASKASCCVGKSTCDLKSGGQGLNMSSICQKACAMQDYDPKAVVAALDARIGDLTTCPVSGVVFKVTEASSKVKYKDQEIFTCCSSCTTLYNHDPESYSKALK